MSVTDGIGQTPCSLEHYLLVLILHFYSFCVYYWSCHYKTSATWDSR